MWLSCSGGEAQPFPGAPHPPTHPHKEVCCSIASESAIAPTAGAAQAQAQAGREKGTGKQRERHRVLAADGQELTNQHAHRVCTLKLTKY